MYLYELPTTGALSFSDFCVDQSSNKAYTYRIPEATQARANLRGVLKESKRTDHGEQDYLSVVKLIEEYLPHLRSIMNCVAHDEIGLKTEPIFSWRTTLSANIFHSSPRLSLPGLHADYAFTLLTYAFALSNLAHSMVTSLGTYEHDRAISDTDRNSKDEQLKVAIGFICKASGIFSHISDTVLPEWEVNRAGGPPGFNKPPDLSREVIYALAKMSLADAQTLAIRKLLSKSAYDSNIAPGPPLPKSHPSPALISKLHLECVSLYSSARTLAKTPGSAKALTSESSGEVSAELRKYLSEETAFHSALAHKWLGVEAGERGGSSKGGEAVSFVAWSKKELEDMKDGGLARSVTIGKGEKVKKNRRKETIANELINVGVFLKHYKKMNDSVYFQPVPSQMDLQARIPVGQLAIAAKPFDPPVPIFGPGSVDYLRRQASELNISDNTGGDITSAANASSPASNYAGAGAYF
ncbi:BRO1 domain-containing protein [Crucibulum laeve]|uniref:pH-response regulator protein palC n=1 Tax=Crucibulum laeve TaxID=68775 RepID=A0A5C3MK74_9AGAR|nr:BRO1 domain-containing protein [Crucibulum laeve]